jgi:hypothetical protein
VSPVRYELGLYIQVDGILHNHCRENLEFYNMNYILNTPHELGMGNKVLLIYKFGNTCKFLVILCD